MRKVFHRIFVFLLINKENHTKSYSIIELESSADKKSVQFVFEFDLLKKLPLRLLAGSTRQGKENGATVVNHVPVSERNCLLESKIIILVSFGLSTEKPSTPPPTVAPGIAAGCGNSSHHKNFI